MAKKANVPSGSPQFKELDAPVLLGRLKSNNRSEIGLIKNQIGVYSKSVLESLDILLETHFPESVPLEADEHTKSVNTQEFFTQDNDNIFVNQQSGSTANIKAYFCSENDLKNSIVNEKSV